MSVFRDIRISRKCGVVNFNRIATQPLASPVLPIIEQSMSLIMCTVLSHGFGVPIIMDFPPLSWGWRYSYWHLVINNRYSGSLSRASPFIPSSTPRPMPRYKLIIFDSVPRRQKQFQYAFVTSEQIHAGSETENDVAALRFYTLILSYSHSLD